MATASRMVFSDTPVPHKTLGQLSEDWLEVLGQIAEAEGEVTPESEKTLATLAELLGDKVDGIGHVLKSLELQAIGYRERAAFHTAAAKARENARDRLKDYLATILLRMNTKKLAGAEFTAYLRESESVEITDQSKLPAGFWRHVQPEVDKKGIGTALKAGQSVPGATLIKKVGAYVR